MGLHFCLASAKRRKAPSRPVRPFSAFACNLLNALEVRAHSDPPPVSPRASRDMSGTPSRAASAGRRPAARRRPSPPRRCSPTSRTAPRRHHPRPAPANARPVRRSSDWSRTSWRWWAARADGTTRNEVRHPSRACLVCTDGASPRLLPRARKRVASDADSKRRAMTRRRPRSVPRGADDVETTRARGSRRDDARTPRRHVARLAVAPLAPLRGSARREDRATDGGERHFEGKAFSQTVQLSRVSRETSASTTVSRFRLRRRARSF